MSMQQQITELVQAGLSVAHLEVINESAGHNVPPGSETHFKLIVVSPTFVGMSRVQRHRAIYALLQVPLANGVHALALHTWTAEEWAAQQQKAPDSPPCRGGPKTL